jgi:hypothetical protein
MTCASIISPSSALLFFFLILGGVLALPMTAEFKRMAINEKMRNLVEKEAASDAKQHSAEAQEARTIATSD